MINHDKYPINLIFLIFKGFVTEVTTQLAANKFENPWDRGCNGQATSISTTTFYKRDDPMILQVRTPSFGGDFRGGQVNLQLRMFESLTVDTLARI